MSKKKVSKSNSMLIGTGLYKVFFLCLTFFPLLCALDDGKELLSVIVNKKFALLLLLLFTGMIFLFYEFACLVSKYIKNADIKRIKAMIVGALFTVSMFVKYFMISVIGDNIYQNSEYGCVLNIASGDGSTVAAYFRFSTLESGRICTSLSVKDIWTGFCGILSVSECSNSFCCCSINLSDCL